MHTLALSRERVGNLQLVSVHHHVTQTMAECDSGELFTTEIEEIELKVKNFLQDGCGCSHGKNGSPCSLQFSEALILENLRNCMELSHGEHPSIYLSGSLWRKTKAKSSECFYFSGPTNLQRNVSSVVWNKLFSISLAKRPL